MRKPEVFLGGFRQVRGQDDTPGVPRPMLTIERSVMFRNQGIPCVAKDRLHEVEVADQSPWGEETNLHGLVAAVSGYRRSDEGAYQKRYPRTCWVGAVLGERQLHARYWRCYRSLKKSREDMLGNGSFVSRDRQSPFGDVEGALRGPTIRFWIVQYSVSQSVGTNQLILKRIFSIRQAEFACHPVMAQDQRGFGNLQCRGKIQVGKMVSQESLNASVHGSL